MWLGSIRPRSQCVGGMLLVQWCHKHVLNCLSDTERKKNTAQSAPWEKGRDKEGLCCTITLLQVLVAQHFQQRDRLQKVQVLAPLGLLQRQRLQRIGAE